MIESPYLRNKNWHLYDLENNRFTMSNADLVPHAITHVLLQNFHTHTASKKVWSFYYWPKARRSVLIRLFGSHSRIFGSTNRILTSYNRASKPIRTVEKNRSWFLEPRVRLSSTADLDRHAYSPHDSIFLKVHHRTYTYIFGEQEINGGNFLLNGPPWSGHFLKPLTAHINIKYDEFTLILGRYACHIITVDFIHFFVFSPSFSPVVLLLIIPPSWLFPRFTQDCSTCSLGKLLIYWSSASFMVSLFIGQSFDKFSFLFKNVLALRFLRVPYFLLFPIVRRFRFLEASFWESERSILPLHLRLGTCFQGNFNIYWLIVRLCCVFL